MTATRRNLNRTIFMKIRDGRPEYFYQVHDAICQSLRKLFSQKNMLKSKSKFKPVKKMPLLPNPVTTYSLPPRLHHLLAPPPPPLLRPFYRCGKQAASCLSNLLDPSHDALKWKWWQMQPLDPMAKTPGFKRCRRLLNLQVRCCLFQFALCPWLYSARRSLFSFASQPVSGSLNASSCLYNHLLEDHLKTAHSAVPILKGLHKQNAKKDWNFGISPHLKGLEGLIQA